jgi:hypothetical protein
VFAHTLQSALARVVAASSAQVESVTLGPGRAARARARSQAGSREPNRGGSQEIRMLVTTDVGRERGRLASGATQAERALRGIVAGCVIATGALLAPVTSEAQEGSAATPAVGAAPVTPTPPQRNDYGLPESWLCRPGREDVCDTDLSSTTVAADGSIAVQQWQANPDAKIDCFYVYPTVSFDPTPNSDMNMGPSEIAVVRAQAARFASQCRVFAPLYRQITLSVMRTLTSGSPGSGPRPDASLAYGDVADAWKHYLENDNEGRGVVLIGHSQGSGHLTQLIRNEIDGKPIQSRIVSALLIGTSVAVKKGQDKGGAFQSMPLCRSSDQTGCVVAYASFRASVPPPANSPFGRVSGDDMEAACTHPAALAGGPAELDAYLAAAPGQVGQAAREVFPWVTPAVEIETPYVSVPGLLTGECVRKDGASYLAVTVNADSADPRTDEIAGDVEQGGQVQASFGLHIVDMHLVMGDLVSLVGQQAEAYLATQARAATAE